MANSIPMQTSQNNINCKQPTKQTFWIIPMQNPVIKYLKQGLYIIKTDKKTEKNYVFAEEKNYPAAGNQPFIMS